MLTINWWRFESKEILVALRELTAPSLKAPSLSITYSILYQSLILSFDFLNLLLKFYGRLGENLYCHINEFIITCSTIQYEGIT